MLLKKIQQVKAASLMIIGYSLALLCLIAGFFFPVIPFMLGFLFTLGFLLAGALGKTNFKQASAIDDNSFADTRQGTSASVARTVAKTNILFGIPVSIAAIILTLCVLAILIFVTATTIQPTFTLSINALGSPMAILLVALFGRRAAKGLKISGNSNLPKLSVEDGNVIIDIVSAMTSLGGKGKLPPPIKVALNEIENMKVLNLQEVRAMGKYKIGPDVMLFAQSKIDLFKYLSKKIDRPGAYFDSFDDPSLTYLMIQASGLFYVFAGREEQVKLVYEAWQAR